MIRAMGSPFLAFAAFLLIFERGECGGRMVRQLDVMLPVRW